MKTTTYYVCLLQVLVVTISNIATVNGQLPDFAGREDELGLSNHNPKFEHSRGPCELCMLCRTFAATMANNALVGPSIARVCDRVHCHNCALEMVGGQDGGPEQQCTLCQTCNLLSTYLTGNPLADDISAACFYVHCSSCADTLVKSLMGGVVAAEGHDPCKLCQVCDLLQPTMDAQTTLGIGPAFKHTCFYNHCYQCGQKLVTNFIGK